MGLLSRYKEYRACLDRMRLELSNKYEFCDISVRDCYTIFQISVGRYCFCRFTKSEFFEDIFIRVGTNVSEEFLDVMLDEVKSYLV